MVAKAKMEKTGINPDIVTFVVAGGSAGNHVVTGIKLADTIISVVGFILVEGAPNTFTALNLTSEFSISADDQINNTGGTTSAAGILFVTYANNPNA